MSGTPDNVHIWDTADVYVGFDNPANPANAGAVFGAGWDLIGVLQEGSSFTTTFDEDQSDVNSWNAGRVRRTYRNSRLQVGFVAIEWNDTVRRLINRGVVPDDEIIIPSGPPERVKIAFVKIDGDQEHREIFDTAEVILDGDIEAGSEDPTSYSFIAHIFGDDGVAGTFQTNDLTSA